MILRRSFLCVAAVAAATASCSAAGHNTPASSFQIRPTHFGAATPNGSTTATSGEAQLSSPISTTLSPTLALQQALSSHGFPTGPIDGENGPHTQQALCALRDVAGLPGGLQAPVDDSDMNSLRSLGSSLSSGAIPGPGGGTFIAVDQVCQVAFAVDHGKVTRVFPVSTGKASTPTTNGSFTIKWRSPGWTPSTEFPGAQMYDFSDIYGSTGLHGVEPGELTTYPASHGCIRMNVPDISYLWDHYSIGSQVIVYGGYVNVD